MVWALLAILGVPIWLVVGILLAIVVQRRNFKNQPGVFPCAVRDEESTKWPRPMSYARQVRGVFVVNRGAALLRTAIHAVDNAADIACDDCPKKLVDPVARRLTLADGTHLDVAVSTAHVEHVDALKS